MPSKSNQSEEEDTSKKLNMEVIEEALTTLPLGILSPNVSPKKYWIQLDEARTCWKNFARKV